MEHILLTALVLVTYGSASFIMKVVGMRLDKSSATIAIVVGYAAAGTALSLSNGGTLGFSVGHVIAGLIGAFYIIGNWAFLRLAKTEELSVIAPLAALSVSVPVLLGIFLLGEPITLMKALGILAAMVSAWLLSAR